MTKLEATALAGQVQALVFEVAFVRVVPDPEGGYKLEVKTLRKGG